MRLEPSDPDIETVVTRIERKDLDLQPEFQRGEVWGKAKTQRLIDSILRDWHIPPIHVIELKESRRQEVLDGQQRLVAIRDFVRGEFPVDGTFDPPDPQMHSLHGLKYRELPDEWRRRFNQFTLRIFRIIDYRPQEPGELFFRLNQPTSLTAAEQRNAFFGPVRSQIKNLVAVLMAHGVESTLLGFSNARMAYDDIIARVALTVQRKTLSEKITASALVDLYRSEDPLPDEVVYDVQMAIELLGRSRAHFAEGLQLNKATIHSWFLFVVRGQSIDKAALLPAVLTRYLSWFEAQRTKAYIAELEARQTTVSGLSEFLLRTFNDRSTARVADVSSVLLRDVALWLEFEEFLRVSGVTTVFAIEKVGLDKARQAIEKMGPAFEDDVLARNLMECGWGKLL